MEMQKNPLDFIDTYPSKWCLVLEWMVQLMRIGLIPEQKQQYFEDAGLFATNSKFGDEDEERCIYIVSRYINE